MEDYKKKIQLGLFVAGGVVLFLAALFYLGKENNLFNKTFTVLAVFKNVEGLNSGDNVWLSGVKIGTVKDVTIVTEGKVIVSMALKEKQNQFIKKDATASVGSDGLVGNKIVVIRPGLSKTEIDDYDTINSQSPVDTQDVINLAKDVGTNTKSITGDLKLIIEKINRGEGLLGEIVNDGEISQDIRATISLLKVASNNTLRVSQKMDGLLTEVQHGQGLMAHLLNDSSYTNSFKAALKDISEVGANAKTISADLQKITDQLNSKDNIVHVLIADSSAANDLKKTITTATMASEKLDENMTALQSNFLLRRYFKKKEKEAKN